jgi:Fic family protein
MPVYVHHSKKGPDFTWDQAKIAVLLAQVRYRQGRFLGRLEGMGADFRAEAQERVRQLDLEAFVGADERLFAKILSDAVKHYAAPLTSERLLRWHSALSPVRPAAASRGKIHFQVSITDSSDGGMLKLVHWLNAAMDIDPMIKAGVGYVWVLLKGSWDGGNGRLAELVMELLMARANQGGERFYSVLVQMRSEQRECSTLLKKLDRASLDVTNWIEWFLGCVGRAIDNAGEVLGFILKKDRFWERHAGSNLNDRQRMVIAKLLDNGEEISSSQWAVLTKTSQDTAGRDINELVRLRILKKGLGGGRSTCYVLDADKDKKNSSS